MATNLVTVIVPMFNAEDTLHRTVLSILNQTHSNLELLLIDDGSTDRTAATAREIASGDRRVTVIGQTNQGVAAARNRGLTRASGDYIVFVDADDMISPRMIECMVETALKADTGLVRCSRAYGSENFAELSVMRLTRQRLATREELQEFSRQLTGPVNSSACLFLFHRERFAGVSFRAGITHREDLLFCLDILAEADSIALIPNAFYLSVARENSSSRAPSQYSEIVRSFLLVAPILDAHLKEISADLKWYRAAVSRELLRLVRSMIFLAGTRDASGARFRTRLHEIRTSHIVGQWAELYNGRGVIKRVLTGLLLRGEDSWVWGVYRSTGVAVENLRPHRRRLLKMLQHRLPGRGSARLSNRTGAEGLSFTLWLEE